ncbi:cysteine--tRNA ligase [Candidatus Shapirobacteria bacterium]|nr:cysteine--tRNA ligase [Candidatus Shapirobacteria bacterium]
MKDLLFFNNLSRRKEKFRPLFPPRVRIYSCGPTVYDHPHLGHMRTYVNTDILLRTLKYWGFEPFQVMNITDVGHLTGDRDLGEDKLEKRAREKKENAWEIARRYEKEFFRVLEKLNISPPSIAPRATENIQEMILLVKELEKKGFTYQTPDGIYFDTSKISDYGKLAHLSKEKLKEGARVEPNPYKKNPTDFALWKFSPRGVKRQMEWESPWREKSFPGWHIECSAMAMKYLTPCFVDGQFFPEKFATIDIHTGGIDHIPVHHTNEIAQSEAATGKRFVNYWIHFAFLEIEGKKMSKSLGNFYSLSDLTKRGYKNLMPLRYFFLTAHYRRKMNFTWEALEGAKKAYQGLIEKMADLLEKGEKKEKSRRTEEYQQEFSRFLENDLNTPRALALLWQVFKDKKLKREEKIFLVVDFDHIFGLKIKNEAEELLKSRNKNYSKIKELVEEREKLREERRWEEADKIRQEIEKAGYLLEDTAGGTKVRIKK